MPDADADAWRPFHQNLRNSTIGAAMAAAGFLGGNVVGGPIGGLVGGLAGVAVGVLTEETGVESFPTTIANMTPPQRQSLARAIGQLLLEAARRAGEACNL